MSNDSRQAEPSNRFILELAKALKQAKHQNVAEAMAAGMLWAMNPDWFTKNFERKSR